MHNVVSPYNTVVMYSRKLRLVLCDVISRSFVVPTIQFDSTTIQYDSTV